MRDTTRPTKKFTRISSLVTLSTLLMCVVCPRAFAAGTTLNWNPNTEPHMAGYKVHYGLATGSYQNHLDVGMTLSRTFTNLADGTTYYFAVTAYDSFGNESVFSKEVSITTSGVSLETISTPLAPSGPATGSTGVAYTYTTGGSVSGAGDPVQYRFSWSDGSVSDWLPAASAFASKAWSAPGTYALVRVQARCALHQSIVSAASPSITVKIAAGAAETASAASAAEVPTALDSAVPQASHVLWTRSDTGQAVLSEIAADTVSGTITVTGSAYLHSPSGVGEQWRATSYAQVDDSTGYVLWTHGGTGQAELWKVDPDVSGTIPILSAASLAPPAGGGPWEATGYSHMAASTGYVLWTRGDTGQAELWAVDSSVAGSIEVISTAVLPTPEGGGPWKATSYVHIDASTGYVLWTRSDNGQAMLWEVDPSFAGTIPVIGSAALASPSGAGGLWQATDYTHVDASTGYVLWTRSDTGQAELWKVDPAAGGVSAISSADLSSSFGMGGPWQATDYAW